MQNETLSAFQRILAEAKAKAEAQATGKPYKAAPTPKATAVPIPKPTPAPPPAPVVTAPELSSTTIADLIGQPKVVAAPNKYNLNIIQYSDKAVAVVGDTQENKARLKALGGSYNPYLRCGKGWVFPKYKEALIRAEFGL